MKLNIIPLMFLLVAFVSCKRSGFDYSNGFDDGLPESNVTVDTNMSFVDVSLYQRARIFPGLVGTSVPRLHNISRTFDFSFDNEINVKDLRVSVIPKPVFSTGFYAPAGELVKVIVPSGISGLTLQIGAHEDDLSSIATPRRGTIIYSTKELFPGVNYLRNLYGGVIWIRAKKSIDVPVTLNISGVVEMPDFELGKISHTEWFQKVKDTDVPWLELKSSRTIYTVPRYMILRMNELGTLSNMEEVMTEWNRVYEQDFYAWIGLVPNDPDVKHRAPHLPERGVLDIHPVAGYAHSGYPWVAQLDDYWTDEWVNINTIRGGGAWGTYHEIGHNYQQGSVWSWAGMGETTNNLFVFKGANRHNTFPTMAVLRQQIPSALAFATTTGAKLFDNNTDPFFKLTPFLQIFDLAVNPVTNENGWGFMPYLNRLAREVKRLSNNDQDRKDFLYEKLCDYTQMDYAKFFDAWGIQVSSQSRQIVVNKGYPAITKQIWTYNPITKTGGNSEIPIVNQGLRINGLSWAELSDVSLFNFGVKPNRTVQVTLKSLVHLDGLGYANIIGKKDKNIGESNLGWQLFHAGWNVEFRAANISNWIPAGPINDTEWHVLTLVFDGQNSRVRIYNNGVLYGDTEMTNSSLDADFPFRIGQIPGNYQNANMNSIYKEVRIFNRAFSGTEVKSISCLPKIGPTHEYYNNLIGYWKLDESSGSIVPSSINSLQNLTVKGTGVYEWRSFTDLPLNLCN